MRREVVVPQIDCRAAPWGGLGRGNGSTSRTVPEQSRRKPRPYFPSRGTYRKGVCRWGVLRVGVAAVMADLHRRPGKRVQAPN